MYFIFYIVFSNWFKLKTVRNYFGINFFDLFYMNMVMKNIWIRVFRVPLNPPFIGTRGSDLQIYSQGLIYSETGAQINILDNKTVM